MLSDTTKGGGVRKLPLSVRVRTTDLNYKHHGEDLFTSKPIINRVSHYVVCFFIDHQNKFFKKSLQKHAHTFTYCTVLKNSNVCVCLFVC